MAPGGGVVVSERGDAAPAGGKIQVVSVNVRYRARAQVEGGTAERRVVEVASQFRIAAAQSGQRSVVIFVHARGEEAQHACA